MRQLKFRAWDSDRQIMYYDLSKCTAHFDDSDMYPDNEGKLIVSCSQQNGDYQELELTQFTGMHDKTGRDIYEGDVVQWANDYPLCPKCTAHRDENLSYGFCPRCGSKIETGKNLLQGTVVFEHHRWNFSRDRAGLYGISDAMLKETEVIGNCYQHRQATEAKPLL